jgi:hypothetical protein
MTENAETLVSTKPSAKREAVANVASVATTIVLGIAANVLIKKISGKVHDTIAEPEAE